MELHKEMDRQQKERLAKEKEIQVRRAQTHCAGCAPAHEIGA